MVTYGTTAIPSDQITVLSGGTVSISVAFENTIGLIGGMDTGNGSATPGNSVEVDSPSDAAGKFGDGSELHEQTKLAYNNGAGTVYALPVSETTVTSETQTTQSGSVDNTPVFDPRVNDEHSVTVTDTGAGSASINLVDEPPSGAPSTADQVDFYPPTGEYYADATPDGDYEFDYDYGDYSATEIDPLLDESPRIVGLCTENESTVNTLATELNSRATDFDFMHGVAGAQVAVDPPNYTDGVDERRISLVHPSRGWEDDAETNEVRTVGAVGGYLASLALGLSATNDSIGGMTGLKNDLGGPTDAGDLIDEQVLPLLDYPPITIAKDMTTSTTPKFERVFTMQIVDEATEASHQISRVFVGEQNTQPNRLALARSHRNTYLGFRDGTPALLDDFTVSVKEDSSNANEVDVNIGLDPVDVMDIIDVTITVGDVVRNAGAN